MSFIESKWHIGRVALCMLTLLTLSSKLAQATAAASANSLSTTLNNAIRNDLNNLHFPQPTSSPFVQAAASAAAAAALGGLDPLNLGRSVARASPPSAPISADKAIHHSGTPSLQSSSPSGSLVVKIATLDSTTAAPVLSSASLHKLQKHLNKKPSDGIDKLHKFDLFVDPVCEQITKLTEKQLNKVFAQLKQFSQLVSFKRQ